MASIVPRNAAPIPAPYQPGGFFNQQTASVGGPTATATPGTLPASTFATPQLPKSYVGTDWGRLGGVPPPNYVDRSGWPGTTDFSGWEVSNAVPPGFAQASIPSNYGPAWRGAAFGPSGRLAAPSAGQNPPPPPPPPPEDPTIAWGKELDDWFAGVQKSWLSYGDNTVYRTWADYLNGQWNTYLAYMGKQRGYDWSNFAAGRWGKYKTTADPYVGSPIPPPTPPDDPNSWEANLDEIKRQFLAAGRSGDDWTGALPQLEREWKWHTTWGGGLPAFWDWYKTYLQPPPSPPGGETLPPTSTGPLAPVTTYLPPYTVSPVGPVPGPELPKPEPQPTNAVTSSWAVQQAPKNPWALPKTSTVYKPR